MDIDRQVALVNQELKITVSKVKVRRRNKKLYLQATLPPKPGKENKGHHQQEIALGLEANEENVLKAKHEAIALSVLLKSQKFSWSLYGVENKSDFIQTPISIPNKETIGSIVKRFEKWYLEKGIADNRRPYAVKKTLRGDYLDVFKKLNPAMVLTKENTSELIELILSTPPDTRARKRAKNAIAYLTKFAGISLDLSDITSSYSVKNTVPRILPTDEEIEFYYKRIADVNPSWAYIFGILATFGLRPQEVFYSDLNFKNNSPFLLVLEGKTKTRNVLPYPNNWVNKFNLLVPNLPKNVHIPDYWDSEVESDLSNVPCKAFKRLNVPFPPYHLRHAWAVRTLLMGLDISLAAKQMGHSVKIHTDTYHYWINKHVQLQAWKKANKIDDRT